MPERALIIAIEHYGHVAGNFVEQELKGTLKSALEFRDWLLKKWRQEGKSDGVIYLCSDPQEPGQRGATRADIVDALIQLEKDGVNKTDNLYVYFSGHGFRLAKVREPLSDVLVASDFIDVQRSADCCFKLDALIDGLRGSLGHGCHFYFIDACRNEVTKAIAGSLMPFESDGDEEPSWFVLQSTVAGSPALVGGPFAATLRDGLNGAGKAKVWDPPIVDSMKVRFDSLRRYVTEAVKGSQPITQKSGGEKGESDVVLATIKPVQPSIVTITLADTPEVVNGQATVTSFDGAQTVHAITGRMHDHRAAAEPLQRRSEDRRDRSEPAGKVPFEAYQDVALPVFSVASGLESTVETLSAETVVHVAVPDGAAVVLRHADTGEERRFSLTGDANVPVGTYVSTLQRQDGQVIRRQEVLVESRVGHANVSPAKWGGAAASESIADRVPRSGDGFIWLSETLGGPVADPDLNVWLSIIGAGRVIGSKGEFSKIANLSLTVDFSQEVPGASPIYVLAGFDTDDVRLRVGINAAGAIPDWSETIRPPALAGVREMVAHPIAGQSFVTFAIDDQPGYTLTTDTTARSRHRHRAHSGRRADPGLAVHWCRSVICATGSTRRWRSTTRIAIPCKTSIRSRSSRAHFASGAASRPNSRALSCSSCCGASGSIRSAARCAAYELMRRRHAPRDMAEVASNMERFFAALPDSTAIARVVRGDARPPTGVPLFLDGLRVFPNYPGLAAVSGGVSSISRGHGPRGATRFPRRTKSRSRRA